VAVGASTVQGVDVIVDASRPLPPRPSFIVTRAGLPVSSDLTTLFPDALSPQRITLKAQAALGAGVGTIPEATAPSFPVSFQGCAGPAGVDNDFDNLPDLYPRVVVVKLDPSDPSGLRQDPATTIIPAAIDPTPFLGPLGVCGAGNTVAAAELSVILAPVAVRVTAEGFVQGPIPPGRYGIVLMSRTGQTWRIPNELQPSLLAPESAATPAGIALLPQGVAIGVAAQVPVARAGAIAGVVRLSGYSPSAIGTLVLAAYASSAPPPPLGTGRPVAVQIVPRAVAAAFSGSPLPYQMANLADGSYLVAALHDRLNRFSGLLSFMATPPLGGQIAFVGGAVPIPIAVSGGPVPGNDVVVDAVATPMLPFERPSFAPDPSSQLSVSSAGSPATALLKLNAVTPAALPYTVSGGPAFHPVPARDGSGLPYRDPSPLATNCGSSGLKPWVSTQVYVTPIDTGSPLVPLVIADQCQFCQSLTGTADCTAAPTTITPMAGPIALVVTNTAVDPRLIPPAPVADLLPVGRYAITVVEPTGLVWTLPNELVLAGGTNLAQGATFAVTP